MTAMDDQHDRVFALLGPFALDAVDPEEAAEVERHLETCRRCKSEVDQLREVAAAIGNSAERPPEALWERIAADLGPRGQTAEAPGLPTGVVPSTGLGTKDRGRQSGTGGSSGPNRRRAWSALGVGVAAACAALALVFGVSWSNANGRLGQLQDSLSRQGSMAAVGAALDSPGRRVLELRSTGGKRVAELVVRRDGAGYVVRSDMGRLPVSETYQMWAQIAGQPISLGLLGPAVAPGDAFALGSAVARARTLMVTVEPSGGVVAPNHAPIASATFR
jgi:anti-sigma-K factor RskA